MGAASLVVLEAADPNPATFLANTVYLRKVTDPSIRTIGVAASGNVSTLDYVVPSDAIVGDVLVLVTVAGNNALTTPAGWTLRQSPITPTTTNQVSLYVFTKVCAAGDPGSAVTVGGAGINRRIGLVFAVQDVNATTRYDVAGNNTSETATTTRTLASVTATLRDLPIAFATDRASSTVPASATWTWPTGFTGVYAGRTSAAINAGDVSLGIALGLPVAAGALMGGGNYIGDQAAGKSISIVAGFPSVAGS